MEQADRDIGENSDEKAQQEISEKTAIVEDRE